MSNALTGLIFGIGFSGWIYAMMMRQNGGQIQQSVTIAAVAGVAGFFVIFSLLSVVF